MDLNLFKIIYIPLSIYKFHVFVQDKLGYKLYIWIFLLCVAILLESITFVAFIPFLERTTNNDFFQIPENLAYLHKIVLFFIKNLNIITASIFIFLLFVERCIIVIIGSRVQFIITHQINKI